MEPTINNDISDVHSAEAMWGGGKVAAPSSLDETDGGHCHVAIGLAVSDVQP
jgi:hypothetical protein